MEEGFILVFLEDGAIERRWFEGATPSLVLLQAAVGGYIELVAPKFHAVADGEVWINEEGLGALPPNPSGSSAVGLDLSVFEPFCGPIVVSPFPGGERAMTRLRDSAFHRALEATLRDVPAFGGAPWRG